MVPSRPRVPPAPRHTSAAMSSRSRSLVLVLAAGLIPRAGARGGEKKPSPGAARPAAVDAFFPDEVWGKVGPQIRLAGHKPGGDPEESKLLLEDPGRAQGPA